MYVYIYIYIYNNNSNNNDNDNNGNINTNTTSNTGKTNIFTTSGISALASRRSEVPRGGSLFQWSAWAKPLRLASATNRRIPRTLIACHLSYGMLHASWIVHQALLTACQMSYVVHCQSEVSYHPISVCQVLSNKADCCMHTWQLYNIRCYKGINSCWAGHCVVAYLLQYVSLHVVAWERLHWNTQLKHWVCTHIICESNNWVSVHTQRQKASKHSSRIKPRERPLRSRTGKQAGKQARWSK